MSIRVLVVFLVFFGNLLFAADIKQPLNQMSFKERVLLNHFFHRTIAWDHLGYVLFFDTKPACLTPVHTQRDHHFPNELSRKGWLVWKKYEHLFPHPNFIFCEEKQKNSKYFHLIVVNKSSLYRTLIEHEDLFHNLLDEFYMKALNQPFSIDLFMEKLERGKKIKPLINGNETLLGIILGYDRESAVECLQRKERLPETSQSLFAACGRDCQNSF